MTSKSRRGSRRIKGFGLALVASLALGALIASNASALSLTPTSGTYPVSLTPSAPGGVSFHFSTKAEEVGCGGSTGSGQLTNSTSGEVKITYTGCNYYGVPCQAPGQPSGTMVTSSLSVTPVYLDAAHKKWGFKLTPIGSSVFAECISSLNPNAAFQFTGSVLSQDTDLIGITTKFLSHEQTLGTGWTEQAFQQIEGAGTKYHLELQYREGTEITPVGNAAILAKKNVLTTGVSVKINP